jgi:FkbM family methyltransferase
LNTNDTFVDIGANIGLFSLIASKSVGSAGLVLAFEPASVTYNRLLENIALNNFKNIRPFQFALSDTNGHAELQILSNGYDAWNSLSTPPLGAEVQVESVETQTLDSCFERERIPFPVLMKVDVEGWEVPVLRGAKKLLSDPNAPCLIVEFTEQNARNAGFSCHELYDLLVFYGYKLFTYDAAQNRLIPESRRASYPYVNVIATKSEELVMNRLSLSFKS